MTNESKTYIIPEDSPLRKAPQKELLAEIEKLSVLYWKKMLESNNLSRQNDLLYTTINKMIGAVGVLRGDRGASVAAHVANIVTRSLGKIKNNDYSLDLSDVLEFVKEFSADETLPIARIKLATDAEAALRAIFVFVQYNRLSPEAKEEFDKQIL